jgi:uncharacterized cofD-like protein
VTGAGPRVAALGGRSGPSLLVQGLRGSGWRLTAIVATTDSGSSSGVIREQFGLPAPGDIRSVLALAACPPPESALLPDLFEFRFRPSSDGSLRGMALGNLVLAALAERLGGMEAAVAAAAGMLRCWATVLPVPSEPARLCARLMDGRVVHGELAVRGVGKAPITELFLEPAEVRVSEACTAAIREADLVVLGPGGLYCSVLPSLLPPPIGQAIRARRGKTVYVCNTTTQPGQTDGLDAAAHVRELIRYLGDGQLDYVLLNTRPPSAEMLSAYRADDVHYMPVTTDQIETIRALGPVAVAGDLVEEAWEGKRALHKLDTIRHDPAKVAEALRSLLVGC